MKCGTRGKNPERFTVLLDILEQRYTFTALKRSMLFSYFKPADLTSLNLLIEARDAIDVCFTSGDQVFLEYVHGSRKLKRIYARPWLITIRTFKSAREAMQRYDRLESEFILPNESSIELFFAIELEFAYVATYDSAYVYDD